MAKKRLQNFRALSSMVTALGTILILTGCDNSEGDPDSSTAEQQPLTTIGISLAAPGLISGIDPEHVTGVEVDLAVDLSRQLGVISSAEEVTWVATEGSQSATQLASGELDLVIGQISGTNLEDDIAWVGPYLKVEAGLLVRSGSGSEAETGPDHIATRTVSSLEALEDATVCVVAGSLADSEALPGEHHTTQQTVSACETGMRSGRYDAIAADDVQLAGLLENSSTAESYEMVLWDELAAASDEELPDQFQTSGEYWIGIASDQCEATSTALEQALTDGVVEQHFSRWDEQGEYVAEYVDPDEVTTQHCSS
ncbi:transporter substrate-binding domain-containing protein [Yaniella halotolerans]|uniref:transporter substrate-binding domain-containing protein n=1 Tax=Yaniella halotolerans TaxID=225453 RepID=UPI0003B4694F|nr:transporter substrate-binding domain-containing protein [Yaniella halotolerans]